jgi:predicted amidohydrolase
MNEEIEKVELRQLNIDDYQELRTTEEEAYRNWEERGWDEQNIRTLLDIFPEGQLAILVNDKVVGCALSLIVNYERFSDEHTYNEITGNMTFSTHNSRGDILYGIDVFIRPAYRGLRLGRRLYDARKELCEHLNLKGIVFGGRIPYYYKVSDKLTPKEYIQKVKLKEFYDPTLTFQIANDFHVKKVLKGYLPDDYESKEYAVLMGWDNIYYTQRDKQLSQTKSIVRLGLVQWQMRHYPTVDDVFEQVEYFVDAVSAYKSDFILFPEFFNAPLMARYNQMSEPEAIRSLAQYTQECRDRFVQLAISYNINIITGSMPLIREDKLYNIGYVCRRNGTYDSYEKMHVTPDETRYWGLSGSDKLKIFETDSGKIGVLICYDVEFPELPRLLAEQDMKILFVPFLTDTQNGYSRVRYCARARAIENECFVAIAGSVGNLPKVSNMNIQYGQSAVFTPCDFAFPTNGIKTEATPNTEMILVADVDLDLLSELHTYGSVRNLRDRRTDVFDLRLKSGLLE